MDEVIIYEKPTCTTCKKTVKILEEMGISFKRVNYYKKAFTKNKLKTLLKKMNLSPKEMIRKNEKLYKELGIRDKNLNNDDLLILMVENPDLVQRPIVEIQGKAVLARPAEKITELFD